MEFEEGTAAIRKFRKRRLSIIKPNRGNRSSWNLSSTKNALGCGRKDLPRPDIRNFFRTFNAGVVDNHHFWTGISNVGGWDEVVFGDGVATNFICNSVAANSILPIDIFLVFDNML